MGEPEICFSYLWRKIGYQNSNCVEAGLKQFHLQVNPVGDGPLHLFCDTESGSMKTQYERMGWQAIDFLYYYSLSNVVTPQLLQM